LGIDGMTDEHLAYLQRLGHLELLYIADGSYSRDALQKLRQSLPNCEILVGNVDIARYLTDGAKRPLHKKGAGLQHCGSRVRLTVYLPT
jgi:hypothetical protein